MEKVVLALNYELQHKDIREEKLTIKEDIQAGIKIHAIVSAKAFKQVVEQVNQGKKVLAVAYKGEELLLLKHAGWQSLSVGKWGDGWSFFVDGKQINPAAIAENEGLTVSRMYEWMGFWSGRFEGFEGGIIHFTDFRYT